MLRCLQCNSTLKPTETECFTCGAAVPVKEGKKPFREKFRTILNALFIFFGIVTIASILAPGYAPSLWKSFPVLLVIYLVKNSADQMSESSIGVEGGFKTTLLTIFKGRRAEPTPAEPKTFPK